MTNEPKDKTEAWVEENGMLFSYGYDKGGALGRGLGLSAYPTAWLVDASGTVVFQGSPYKITEEMLEGLLDGALNKPLYEWPSSLSAVKKLVMKKQYAGALDKATALAQSDAEAAEVAESIRGLIDGKIRSMQKAAEEGNYLAATTLAYSASKEFKGLPAADTASELLATLKKDKKAQSVMKGQKAVRKLTQDTPNSVKEIQEQIARLKRLASKYEGTIAATEAEENIEALRKRIR